MIDHIVKKHVTLRVAFTATAQESREPRWTGDCKAFGDQESELSREGEGRWRTEVPQKPAIFLQAIAQWEMAGPSKGDKHALRSLDQAQT